MLHLLRIEQGHEGPVSTRIMIVHALQREANARPHILRRRDAVPFRIEVEFLVELIR
jgi:hypothetical protein